MSKLISKGQFRERANRSQKYNRSENQLTHLKGHFYDSDKRFTENDNKKVHDGVKDSSSH